MLAADQPQPPQPTAAQITQAVNRAADFLKQAQADDGSFSAASGPASRRSSPPACSAPAAPPTIPSSPRPSSTWKAIVHDDGGIYQNGSNHKNYETCLAIIASTRPIATAATTSCSPTPRSSSRKSNGTKTKGKSIDDTSYGGAGYGSHSRPDLSNTSFLIDALHAARPRRR